MFNNKKKYPKVFDSLKELQTKHSEAIRINFEDFHQLATKHNWKIN